MEYNTPHIQIYSDRVSNKNKKDCHYIFLLLNLHSYIFQADGQLLPTKPPASQPRTHLIFPMFNGEIHLITPWNGGNVDPEKAKASKIQGRFLVLLPSFFFLPHLYSGHVLYETCEVMADFLLLCRIQRSNLFCKAQDLYE